MKIDLRIKWYQNDYHTLNNNTLEGELCNGLFFLTSIDDNKIYITRSSFLLDYSEIEDLDINEWYEQNVLATISDKEQEEWLELLSQISFKDRKFVDKYLFGDFEEDLDLLQDYINDHKDSEIIMNYVKSVMGWCRE